MKSSIIKVGLGNSLNKHQELVDTLSARVNELTNYLNNKNEEVQSLIIKNQILINENNELKGKLNSFEINIALLNQSFSQKEEECIKLQKLIDLEKNSNTENREIIRKLQNEISNLNFSIDNYKNENLKFFNELKEFDKVRSKLEKDALKAYKIKEDNEVKISKMETILIQKEKLIQNFSKRTTKIEEIKEIKKIDKHMSKQEVEEAEDNESLLCRIKKLETENKDLFNRLRNFSRK